MLLERKPRTMKKLLLTILLISFSQIFGQSISEIKVETKNIKEKPIDVELLKIWGKFKVITSSKNPAELKNISLTEVYANDSLMKIDKFIDKYFNSVFDNLLFQKVNDSLSIEHLEIEMMTNYLSKSNLKEIDSKSMSFKIEQFQVLKKIDGDCGWTIMFDFVKTRKGYKFLGSSSICGGL